MSHFGLSLRTVKIRSYLIKIPKICKFYQHHKQQREQNCWWKISAAHHTLQ